MSYRERVVRYKGKVYDRYLIKTSGLLVFSGTKNKVDLDIDNYNYNIHLVTLYGNDHVEANVSEIMMETWCNYITSRDKIRIVDTNKNHLSLYNMKVIDDKRAYRIINGTNGNYEVSNDGYIRHSKTNIFAIQSKSTVNHMLYTKLRLSDRTYKPVNSAKCVLEAWSDNPPINDQYSVDFKDHDLTNLRINNITFMYGSHRFRRKGFN